MGSCLKNHQLAHAKINLTLNLLKDRGDGYFEISSLMSKISLYDELSVTVDPSFKKTTISIDTQIPEDFSDWIQPKNLPNEEENLITKAVKKYLDRFESPACEINFKLTKRIPIGAGLGGGSSDAAAALRALQELFNKPLSASGLHEVAAEIGSDVPFFLNPASSAQVSGRGDVVDPLKNWPSCELPVVLYYPGVSVSTREVYQAFRDQKPGLLTTPHTGANMLPDLGIPVYQNSLEAQVFDLYPFLIKKKEEFLEHGAICAGMTGSGSSLFGVFQDSTEAARLARALEGKPFHLLS